MWTSSPAPATEVAAANDEKSHPWAQTEKVAALAEAIQNTPHHTADTSVERVYLNPLLHPFAPFSLSQA